MTFIHFALGWIGVLSIGATSTSPTSNRASPAWVAPAHTLLKDLTAQHATWLENQRLLQEQGLATKPIRELTHASEEKAVTWVIARNFAAGSINNGLWHLWLLTGYCNFASLAPQELPAKVPCLLEDYDRFVTSHEHLPLAEVLYVQLPRNVELLDSPYALFALHVLRSMVVFDDGFYLTVHNMEILDFPSRDERRQLCQEMTKWYEANRNTFEWNDSLKGFAPRGGTTGAFSMPKFVRELLDRGIKERRIGAPRSSRGRSSLERQISLG